MKEIGEIIRRKRKERNLTIERVHIDTRISKKFLNAMEEGIEKDFPAEVYYTGSLRKYAGYLGLNATELVEMYINEKRGADTDNLPGNSGRHPAPVKPLFYIVVLVLLGILTYNVVNNYSNSEALIASVPVKVENLNVVIKCINDSWIRVTLDGKMVYEGVIKPGQEKKFTAKERVILKIGYTPGVKISVNDYVFDVIKGSVKDVNDITVTKEDILKLHNENKT